MFKKAFALASLTALTAVVASSMAAGCSSTSETVTTNDAGPTTGDDAGGTTGKDGGKPSAGDSGSSTDSCYDATGAQALLDTAAVGPGGECTNEQVDSFLTGCIGDTGSDDACTAATSGANEACAKCILGGNGKIPPLLTIGQTSILLNYQACIAIEIGHPECAKIVTNQAFCPATSCSACDQADTAASDACEKEAQGEACADFFDEANIPAGCAEAFAAVKDDDPAVTKCIGDGSSFDVAAALTSKVFCVETHGAADPDAGE